ncbi:hypothetical protein SAMN06296386_10492 [Lachnospiraceae bacterium]|nr:hypothetical protein SAMN06296386_10492 [Lachnospiraceae bacterium]
MISVKIYKTEDGKINGFQCLGHAGFAESGEDIVCAAVSMLVINTINSLEKFLPDDSFTVTTDEESGLIECVFDKKPSEKAGLLLDSMLLGLKSVEENYHGKYLKLVSK